MIGRGGGVLESPLSTTIERNEVVAHLSRAFAVRWREMPAKNEFSRTPDRES